MACEPSRARLLCMLSLTFGFFIVEVVVSRMTASLSMLSDSFHVLSDVIALVVALVSVRFAEKTHGTKKNTFRWIRAEVMGALVNAVCLTALCFTILLKAVERFTKPHEIENPQMVIIVGAVGLLVNLLGLYMFHGNTGGCHGHVHRGHSHGSKKVKTGKSQEAGSGSSAEETNNLVGNHNSPGDMRRQNETIHSDGSELQMNGYTHGQEMDQVDSGSQLNMRGVFLHVLGDALGSVIVIINSLIFYFVWKPCIDGELCINPCIKSHSTDLQHVNHMLTGLKSSGPCWVLYLDPALCLVIVGILLYTTYPRLKESALILLQRVPKQDNIPRLKKRLLSLDGVLAIHDLHIWQLAGRRIIATVHIKCQDPASYMEVAKRIKDFFHNEGIHATIIQPEFVTVNSESRESLCELPCLTQCAPKLCCGTADKRNASPDKKATGDNRAAANSVLEVIIESPEEAAPVPVSAVAITGEVESSL